MSRLSEGKINHHLLKRITELRGVSHPEIIQYPEPGVDVATIDLELVIKKINSYYNISSVPYLVYKSDPITFPTTNPAYYLIVVNKNDLATAGAFGYAMTVNILLPPNSEEVTLLDIQTQLDVEAKKEGLCILGGHSEVTSAVENLVLSGNMIGFVPPEYYIPRNPQQGDSIICSGWIGAEGTGILLSEGLEYFRSHLTTEEFKTANTVGQQIDISKRVLECNRHHHSGINMVHDATEGGILGALYECLEIKGLGANIKADKLPIAPVTQAMSKLLGIDPQKLISSGCVLFFCDSSQEEVIVKFLSSTGFPARIIGHITYEGEDIIMDGIHVDPPKADELIHGLKVLSELENSY
ncbi:MAG: AIR synthase-related protein [Promethearchaeota archaeon]